VELVNSSAENIANSRNAKQNKATAAPAASANRSRRRNHRASSHFERLLADFHETTSRDLLRSIPEKGPPFYDLVSAYPSRAAKGLRAAFVPPRVLL